MHATPETDDDLIQMQPFRCRAQCGRILGYASASDQAIANMNSIVLICRHCASNPDEVMERLAKKE